MTKIEEVARAIEAAPISHWRRNKMQDADNQYEVFVSDDVGDPDVIASFSHEQAARNFCYDWNQKSRARAAIEAMRHPNDAMLDAVMNMGKDCPVFEDEWGAAIDAALAEETK